MSDIVLIVDDEESVRRTFQEWLASSGFGALIRRAAISRTVVVRLNHSFTAAMPLCARLSEYSRSAATAGVEIGATAA
jgi:CheY-like chemotaxis protein